MADLWSGRVNNNDLQVHLWAPTAGGRLLASYDQDAGILSIQSTVARSWPFGVDIDGSLVFDVDADGLLANVDLLVARSLWMEGTLWSWGDSAPSRDIVFTTATLHRKSLSVPISVRTDAERLMVEIAMGEDEGCDSIVAVSQDCQMRLRGASLVGIHVRCLRNGG